MEIRGIAEQVELETPPFEGTSRWIIRIHPRRVVSWNVGAPGMHHADVAPGGSPARDARPAVVWQGLPPTVPGAPSSARSRSSRPACTTRMQSSTTATSQPTSSGVAPMAPRSTAMSACTGSTGGFMHPPIAASRATRSCAC